MLKFAFQFSLAFISIYGYGQVKINEVLASNVEGIVDEDNEYPDWIELYNSADSTVDLAGYSITDDKLVMNKWVFPAVKFLPHTYLLLFASGKDRKTLPTFDQDLIRVGDQWQYIIPASEPDADWKQPGFDASAWSVGNSGFGYGDGDDSTLVPVHTVSVYARKEFTVTNLSDIQSLIFRIDYDDGFVAYINGHEIARSNLGNPGDPVYFNSTTGGISHEATIYQGGEPETYNLTDFTGYLLQGTNVLAVQVHNADSTVSSDLSMIPSLSIVLQGDDSVGSTEYHPISTKFHTNFKIKNEGEGIYLCKGGNVKDSVSAVPLMNDVSYGRKPDGSASWFYFGTPTPEAPNNTNGVLQVSSDTVVFSRNGGYFSTAFSLTLSTNPPGVPVYYTTDGSVPDETDNLYSSPINISGNSIIRARAISATSLPGPVVSNTYYNDYNHDMYVVCLSTKPDNLWDFKSGIFAMGPNPGDYPYFTANFWQDWEKPVYVEIYDKQGNKVIDQRAGIKVNGNWSRANDQKSIALYARSIYGKGSFSYQFFPGKNIDKFESIVLRNSGNDYDGLRFQDGFISGLTEGMDVDRMAMEPAVVYWNGEYWGIENIREKINEHFLASNHHVDPDEVNLLELAGDTLDGNNTGYLQLLNYLNFHSTLLNDDFYKEVAGKIDVNNYIQYQLAEIYSNNTDWPGNNMKFWNTSTAGSKWRWILFDMDFGFGIWNTQDYLNNTLSFALEPNGPDWPNPPWSTLLFRRLVTNMGFRNNFINQYCDRINTNYTYPEVSAHLDSLANLYATEIQRHCYRWGTSYSNWQNQLGNRKIYAQNRPGYARDHMKQVFNLGKELNVDIDVSDKAAGMVKVNTVIPKSFPFNGIYFENIPIKLTALPRPGFKFLRWEGTINSTETAINYNMANAGNFKAVFADATSADISAVINEINFKSSPDRDTKDWVEIYNNGNTAIDLTNWLLSDSGPDSGYVFPRGLILEQNAYLVICRKLKDFSTIHPQVLNVVGELPFGLSSQGDHIMLFDDKRNLIDAVEYYPGSPWPTGADGTGSTLELVDPYTDNTLGANWKASPPDGTPGMKNSWYTADVIPEILADDALLNEFSGFPNPFKDFTTLTFTVKSAGNYRIEITDMSGRLIKTQLTKYLTPNTYYLDWNGTDENNNTVAPGVYFIRLFAEDHTENLKIIKL